jgi:ABC-type sugar transport system ATPase subunit
MAGTLELTSLLGRKPGQISGGERQRVALGRALIRQPRALLLDEPLSNLDAQLRVQMRSEIARLHREVALTTLYVTHDQEEAMILGDRVAVLREGILQQVGPPLELYRRPANIFVAGFVGSPTMNLISAHRSKGAGRGRHESCWFSGDIECGPEFFANHQNITVGIRPHDIRIGEPEPVDAQVIVDAVTPRGCDVLIRASLIGKINDEQITLVLPGDCKISSQERANIYFPREKLHYFDSATGRRLN